ISKDWNQLYKTCEKIIPSTVYKSIHHITFQFRKAQIGYLRSQLILEFITACMIYADLLLFQIEHSLTIDLLTSIVDFIPFIGTGVIFIPWIIYLFFTNNFTLTIFISLLYMTIIIQRQLSEPKVVSNSLGMPPLAVLFCLFLAWQFWGL